MKLYSNIVKVFILLLISPSFAWAGWLSPQETILGVWGSAPGEFYYSEGDTTESFPREFGVDKYGNIYVDDELNSRVQIFDINGILKKIISAPDDVDVSLGWPYSMEIHYEGSFVALYEGQKKYFFDRSWNFVKINDINGTATAVTGGYIFRVDKNKYSFYSTDGQFIINYPNKPLNIGRIKSVLNASGGFYSNIIEYDDSIYNITTSMQFEYFKRDNKDYVNGVFKVLSNDKMSYRVGKYDKCGKSRGIVDFPVDVIITSPEPSQIPLAGR